MSEIESRIMYKNLNEAVKLAMESASLQIAGLDVQIPYLAGAPGGGKTQCIQSLSTTMDSCGVISTHFAITPYEEHSGIPQFTNININGKEMLGTIWSFPAIMKSLYELSDKYNTVIWLLDDMHLCGSVHMALLYELLTEHKLREYKLPPNVAIMLAGNHGHNKAGSKTMFSAIINRIFLMPVITTFDEWRDNFAIKNKVHYSIMSFLKNENYQKYFHEEEMVDAPWGSPRSWTRMSNFLSVKEKWNNNKQLDTSLITYISQGHVSQEACSDFVIYYDIFTKFDIDDILKNYNTFKLPTKLLNQYILCFALCSHLTGMTDTKPIIPNFTNILYRYIQEVPDLGYMMFQEIVDYEKINNKRSLYMNIVKHMQTIDSSIMDSFIELIHDPEGK